MLPKLKGEKRQKNRHKPIAFYLIHLCVFGVKKSDTTNSTVKCHLKVKVHKTLLLSIYFPWGVCARGFVLQTMRLWSIWMWKIFTRSNNNTTCCCCSNGIVIQNLHFIDNSRIVHFNLTTIFHLHKININFIRIHTRGLDKI